MSLTEIIKYPIEPPSISSTKKVISFVKMPSYNEKNLVNRGKIQYLQGFQRKQITGIEPAFPAWEASVLPMNHICITKLLLLLYHDFRKSQRKWLTYIFPENFSPSPLRLRKGGTHMSPAPHSKRFQKDFKKSTNIQETWFISICYWAFHVRRTTSRQPRNRRLSLR